MATSKGNGIAEHEGLVPDGMRHRLHFCHGSAVSVSGHCSPAGVVLDGTAMVR